MNVVETFDTVLQGTARDMYAVASAAHDPSGQRVRSLGEHFEVDPLGTISKAAGSLLATEVAIDYHPIPRRVGADCPRPMLAFEYDGFGDLTKLDYWLDDNAEDTEVFTIYKDANEVYKVDWTKAYDEDVHSNDLFALVALQDATRKIDRNALANYELEKQMLYTGRDISPELVARIISILKQAAADLTYL